MSTVKRTPKDIQTDDIDNYSKYWNTLSFEGIDTNKNIFGVNQDSLTEAKNVYVDEEYALISREPLRPLDTPIDTNLYSIVDIKEVKDITIYETKYKSSDKYTIFAIQGNMTHKLEGLANYKLSIFYQYILCWNDTKGAQVIDINNFETGWQDLSNFAEVPITKIVSGSSTIEKPRNLLSDAYEEQYIMKEGLITELPSADPSLIEVQETNNVQIVTKLTGATLTTVSPELLVPRKLNINLLSDDFAVFAEQNTVVVATTSLNDNKVYVSLNNGDSFSLVRQPTFGGSNKGLSKDGQNYFYLTPNGMYRLSLDDFTWTLIPLSETEFYGYEQRADWPALYVHSDRFAAIGKKGIYYMTESGLRYSCTDVPALPLGSLMREATNDSLVKDTVVTSEYATADTTYYTYAYLSQENDSSSGWRILLSWWQHSAGNFINQNTMIGTVYIDSTVLSDLKIDSYLGTRARLLSISTPTSYYQATLEILYQANDGSYKIATITGFDLSANSWSAKNETVTKLSVTSAIQYSIVLADSYYSVPRELGEQYIMLSELVGGRISIVAKTQPFVIGVVDGTKLDTINFDTAGSYYYILKDKTLYTNYWGNSTVVFSYKHKASSSYYKDVPQVTYSGSELYLANGNTLSITNNIKDCNNILFNLPELNQQSFPDTITNIVNISTSEIAIFFKNDVYICSKSDEADDNGNYAYYYNKTRLSLGARAGDDVINTLDGSATILPTVRGLSLMTYQEYMATTDQTLDFVSDKIRTMWQEFYNAGTIKIVQMQDYIYFTNGTKNYLMYDTRTSSWWTFEVPVAINKLITDQETLTLISDCVYYFDRNFNGVQYGDKIIGKPKLSKIHWLLSSQRLHFKYPNHYKNIRQLIFQLVQTSDMKNTIKAQVKVYRKVIDYGEPQLVAFNVDEYRTFVKRFNYWKINELQWTLSDDEGTVVPAQLKLNGINVKYEIGEEVR